MAKVVYFDLEGPLSPQDNAYEVMGLVENGHQIFEVISRYDDLVALEGREGYEAGDTLSLIAPFLLYHGITEDDIRKVSSRALLVHGTKETISELKSGGWKVRVISTSYEQHARNIGSQLAIPDEDIACTRFPLDSYLAEFRKEDLALIGKAEEEILSMYPPSDDEKIKKKLDSFFFDELMKAPAGKVLREMKVVGGERKVDAILSFALKDGTEPSESVAVGDSITDMKMLEFIHKEGGLSVVFNGNEYAVPYGTVGLATTDMRDILRILSAWEEGGRAGAIEAVKALEGSTEPPFYSVLEGREDFGEVERLHKRMRAEVRGEAAKLG